MYAIHTTPGFVIDSRPSGEAGKLLYIFTRDLGLIAVTAQGIRLEKSKLRYYVQNHSFATFSLVRGKEFWRLTSAAAYTPESLLESDRKVDTSQKSSDPTLIARLAALLSRLLQGEEAHPELFDIINRCVLFLGNQKNLGEDQMKALESLTVLRVLNSLGYIGKEAQLKDFLENTEITPQILARTADIRVLMNRHINNALKESHL